MADLIPADVNIVFNGVINFWYELIKPRMESISIDMAEEDFNTILQEMWYGAKDLPVQGTPFVWCQYTIVGNEGKPCVEGTILDVKSANSDIFPIYKQFTSALRCLKNNNILIPHCFNYCQGCQLYNKEKCIQVIKDLIPLTFDEGGCFDTILGKLEEGNWKL